MSKSEERAVLLNTGCPPDAVDALQSFSESYRTQTGSLNGGEKGSQGQSHNAIKNRRLGTRTLVRMAERLKTEGEVGGRVDVWGLVERTLLTEFMPPTEKMVIQDLLAASQVEKGFGEVNFLMSKPPFSDSLNFARSTPIPISIQRNAFWFSLLRRVLMVPRLPDFRP